MVKAAGELYRAMEHLLEDVRKHNTPADGFRREMSYGNDAKFEEHYWPLKCGDEIRVVEKTYDDRSPRSGEVDIYTEAIIDGTIYYDFGMQPDTIQRGKDIIMYVLRHTNWKRDLNNIARAYTGRKQ